LGESQELAVWRESNGLDLSEIRSDPTA
jgi:hypothetical protein